MPPSAFGPASSALPLELATSARTKIAHGDRRRSELAKALSNWWGIDEHPVKVTTRQHGTFVDIVLVSDKKPPVQTWRFKAHEVLHAFRTALDNFHHEVHQHFGGAAESHTYFPIFEDDGKWARWARSHSHLPQAILDRYRTTQPFATKNPRLLHLRRLDDLEKHPGLVAAAVSFQSMEMLFDTTVEGLVKPKKRSERWEQEGHLNIDSGEAVVTTIDLHYPVVDTVQVSAALNFEPELRFATESIPLMRALEAFRADTDEALATVLGRK